MRRKEDAYMENVNESSLQEEIKSMFEDFSYSKKNKKNIVSAVVTAADTIYNERIKRKLDSSLNDLFSDFDPQTDKVNGLKDIKSIFQAMSVIYEDDSPRKWPKRLRLRARSQFIQKNLLEMFSEDSSDSEESEESYPNDSSDNESPDSDIVGIRIDSAANKAAELYVTTKTKEDEDGNI